MTKFHALSFKSLPNDIHYSFFEKVARELAKAGDDVKDAIEPLDVELNKWFAMETADMAWIRKSALTAAIADADHRLDNALTGLSAQVNAARHNVQPGVALAAEHLHIMLKSYGRVRDKSYQGEVADVNAILAHLNGDYAADAQAAGITGWIPEITAAAAELRSLLEERDAESLGKPEFGFRETRRNIEHVWHQITQIVDGGVALRFSNHFEMFINALNPEIDRLNNEYHRVKRDISKAQPSPIKTQPYTGLFCTPLPDSVLYVTPKGTERLELGKDFNVIYKDNVEVGNAKCTIVGKGAYRGHKTVTFIIARGV